MLLLLPTDSNKLLLQWKGPFEVVEVLNKMDYRIDVNGIIGTYNANILKQYVGRQSGTSHCLFSIVTVAEVDEVDETDEYVLDGCTFSLTQRTSSFKDVRCSKGLSPEQICESESLIEQYPDVLTSLPVRTDIIRHNIKLLKTEPVQSKIYLIPYKTREVMVIQEMFDLGVIEPSVSPYSSPLVLILKRVGSMRPCIDF